MIISIPLTMQETYAPLASPQDDPDSRPIGPAPCSQATRARGRAQGGVRRTGGGTQAVSTPVGVGRLACQYPGSVPQVGSQAVSTPTSSRHHNPSQYPGRLTGPWLQEPLLTAAWPLGPLLPLIYKYTPCDAEMIEPFSPGDPSRLRPSHLSLSKLRTSWPARGP